MAVEVHSDVPDRFTEGMRLWALAKDGSRSELQLEALWPHKEWLVLKFAGTDTISSAELLVGCELQVPSSERAQLEPGWTYVSDLVGSTLFDSGREVGKVKDVRFGAGEAPLLIVESGTAEYEVPYAGAYLKSVDQAGKRIEMVLPEGLLEVNAPLKQNEKPQHKLKSEGTRRRDRRDFHA